MAKPIRYKDGTLLMPGSEAFELYHNPAPKGAGTSQAKTLDGKQSYASKNLSQHMVDLDKAWRKLEGRKPVSELTDREKMLEGRIPFDPVKLKEYPRENN